MPIYEYHCRLCKKVTEKYCKVTRIPRRIRCSCGRLAKRQLSAHGAVHTDGDVKWIPSARMVLQPDSELRTNPIETRSQYNKYLKDHNLACIG